MYHCSVSYTQREVFASHLANTAPSYNQQRTNVHPTAQKEKKEVKNKEELRYRAQMKQPHADKGVANQNTQRKQTKQGNSEKVKTQVYI